MKLYLLTILSAMALASVASAESIMCTGFTDASHQTQVELSIFPEENDGSIRFVSQSGSVTQGLKLTKVSYPTPTTLRYADFSEMSHLDFLVEGGVIKKNSFTHGLYFKDDSLECTVNGKIPKAPACGSNPSDGLVAVLREGRYSQTLAAVNYQLACGADVNFKDRYGCTPLLYAIDAHCGGNRTPAAQSITGLPQVVEQLISNGAFVDIEDTAKKETALLKATKLQVRDVYESFFAAEANFDFQDSAGMTPLMWAVHHGDEWTVKDILQANPDRSLKNKSGQTAFDIAKQWKRDRIADLVRISSSKFEVTGRADGTCSPLLFEAASGQTIEIVLAAADKMFRLQSSDLNLDLMADANTKTSKIVQLGSPGSYRFTCGPHGSARISTGQINVK